MNFKKNVILIVDDTPIELKVLFDFLEFYGFKILVAEECPMSKQNCKQQW